MAAYPCRFTSRQALNLHCVRFLYFWFSLYQNGGIEQKRFIIGSIYPEKWRFFENDCRNTRIKSQRFPPNFPA